MPINYEGKWKAGHLYLLDDLSAGDDAIAPALETYVTGVNGNKNSQRWSKALVNVENLLFSAGHHYLGELLNQRISSDSSGNLFLNEVIRRRIPRPTVDILGRYIETNVAIFTENRPVPRIEPKSDNLEDKHEAKLSELTLQYLWEELDLPEKHRELVKLFLHTGISFLEIYFDPLTPRLMLAPEQIEEPTTPLPGGVQAPVPRRVAKIDPRTGAIVYEEEMQYGDIVANVISDFELYYPQDHSWNRGDVDSGWIMKEYYAPIDSFKNKYLNPAVRDIVTKKNGYLRENIEKITSTKIDNYILWWWERMTDLVEGPRSSAYIGGDYNRQDYTIVRVFDRAPNPKWPKGRTVITAGEQLIYDSPKRVGARVFDKRWPKRWHPYVRYRYESLPGSIGGRSLTAKLLPFLKRIDAIDTTAIMYRRAVPIATWILPQGASPVENIQSPGEAGTFIRYDPNRTNRMEPKPVYPPDYPKSLLEERQMMLQHIEQVAGTEQILRGERPSGVNCWAEGQFLTTKSGSLAPVEDLYGHEMLTMGGAGNIGAYHSREYSGDIYNIKSWGNLPVRVTPNHEFPVITKETLDRTYNRKPRVRGSKTLRYRIQPKESDIERRKVCEIRNGDMLLSGFYRHREKDTKLDLLELNNFEYKSYKLKIPNILPLNEETLWLFGTFLAEGCIMHSEGELSGVQWCFGDGKLADKAERLIREYFPGIHILTVHARNSTYLRVNNRVLANIFNKLFGSGAANKKISEEIFFANTSLLPLVAGWIDGDGSKNGNSIRASTCSANLASQIRGILLDEKIYTTIQFSDRRGKASGFQRNHPEYILVISAADCNNVCKFSERFVEDFKSTNQGRRGFWLGRFYASYVNHIKTEPYEGKVYNITVNELEVHESNRRADNSVNSFGLFTYQSAAMIQILRRQALMGKSPIMQAWDESLQMTGAALLQETKKHIKEDERYRQRLMILAREQASQTTIDKFSGSMISDNVNVRIDTISEAFFAKEAKQERAVEVMQYGPALAQMPLSLQVELLKDLGWPDVLSPQGSDVSRARMIIQFVKNKQFDLAQPMREDDPYVFHELLVKEIKEEGFLNQDAEVWNYMFNLIAHYEAQIQKIERARMQMMEAAAAIGQQGS